MSGVSVTLEAERTARNARRETDSNGRVHFKDLAVGSYVVSVGTFEQKISVAAELVTLQLDLNVSFLHAGRFGRTDLRHQTLSRLPHADTTSSVLETLEPFAITNRIDVAGVESGTDPLWSVRGSSWTQNRVLLDGADITDPAGGASLLYPDVQFFEEISLATSAAPPESAGPGAELQLVTRAGAPSLRGALRLRYTGAALQSENLSDDIVALGVEPREMLRFGSAGFELGAPRFYTALNGFDLSTRIPKFEAEEKFYLRSFTGKLTGERTSFLGILQHLGRPTLGARPGVATNATVDATESFQLAQASVRTTPLTLRLSFARGNLESSFSGEGSPIRDLATGEVSGAPPIVVDRERTRWSAVGSGDWAFSSHLLRAGFEVSYATEKAVERVPGRLGRLTADGAAHSVSLFSTEVARRVGLNRIALNAQDAFFFDFLGRAWRLSPGLRLDFSRASAIRWTSLSGSVRGGVQLVPSTEIHFSAGVYPHTLTTGPHAADEALSWVRRRWTDENQDGEATPDEIGAVLRRGGGDFTSIAKDLPRPVTYELTVGIEKHFRRGFLRFSGYQRWEKRLLQTVNVGIDRESYRRFQFHDVGLDGVLGSDDDTEISVFDQTAQFGEDAFLLTHPEGLESSSQGVDLLLGFDHGRFSWRLSGRAYRDVGTRNPGNEATLNDTGVFGELFDDPNTTTHAEGRLFFDRAFTGKLTLTAQGPGDVRFGTAIRYWDGQPFARHLFFPELGQGFVVVQAFPRGRLRYTFNMTVDVRVEREFVFGRTHVGFALDAFNLFNQTLETGEVVRSGMSFRDPTFVQPARTIVLEARVRF